jgi:hypothetical protein
VIDLDFTPIGFEPHDAVWWPATANALTRPWPREAVLFDLRWWRGQERATAKAKAKGLARRVARMPGRPALCQRWGWGDWDVRSVLKAEAEWRDTWTQDEPSSDPPAILQPPSSPHPATATANADNPPESSSVPPARLQPASSVPPHARSDHRLTDPPITDPEGSSPPAGGAPPKPARVKVPSGAYQLAIDAFDSEHRAIIGPAYPWMFQGRDADGARVKSWLAAARVSDAAPAEGIERIRLAARAYLTAVRAGTAFPIGKPAQARHFTRDLAEWLQTDPSVKPRPPPRAGRAEQPSFLDLLPRPEAP